MTIEELREKVVLKKHDAAESHNRARLGSFQEWHEFGRREGLSEALDLLDQYIAANKDRKPVSDCCGAPMTIVDDVTKHYKYYECQRCGNACDPAPDAGKKVEPICGTCAGQGGYSKGTWIQPCESCIKAGRLDLVVKALSQAVVNLQQRINKWDIL